MNSKTNNHAFINVLRWIAVLPGALIAAFLVTFPLHWILYIGFAHDGTLFGFIELPDGANISIERAIYPAVIALTFVVVGYKIAPGHKYRTSLVLGALYVITFVWALVFMSEQYRLEARSILAFVGLGTGLYWAWRQGKVDRRKVLEKLADGQADATVKGLNSLDDK